jgi:hypothetical protein
VFGGGFQNFFMDFASHETIKVFRIPQKFASKDIV